MPPKKVFVPEGFRELLHEYTIAVLQKRPDDLIEFSCEFFLAKKSPFTTDKLISDNQKESDEKRKTAIAEDDTINNTDIKTGDEQANICEQDEESDEAELEQQPRGRRRGVAGESYNPEAESEAEAAELQRTLDELRAAPKSAEQLERLRGAVRPILLFRSLDTDQMEALVHVMQEMRVEPGHTLIEQGDEEAELFYVIERGTFDILIDKPQPQPQPHGKLSSASPLDVQSEGEGGAGAGGGGGGAAPPHKQVKVGAYENRGAFGELALMYNTPRAATIRATSAGVVWTMSRRVFRHMVLRSAFQKRRLYERLLERVSLLSQLSSYERMSVADALTSRSFEAGQRIVRQGEPGHEMFFVEAGRVRVTMHEVGGAPAQQQEGGEEEGQPQQQQQQENVISEIDEGGYFGELALLTKQPRAASVFAMETPTRVSVLDVEAFERLLGPCVEIIQRNIGQYEAELVKIFGSLENVPLLR